MNILERYRINTWIVVIAVGLLMVLAVAPNQLRSFAQQQAGGNANGAAQGAAELLELGKPIEKELAGGGSHSYQIALAAGQFLNVVVEQRGIDVVVTLFGPDGKQITEVDSPNGDQGPEPLSVIAEVAGAYRLEVRSLEKDAKVGRYVAKLMEMRAATEKDQEGIVRERELQQASQLNAEYLPLLRAGHYDEALPLAEHALVIRERVLGPEHPDVAASLNDVAVLYNAKGDYIKAEPFYRRALEVREKALSPIHPDVAQSLNNLAFFFYNMGDYTSAEPIYQRALAIREKALGTEHPTVATTLNNLGLLYQVKGEYAKAESLHHRALAIREKELGLGHPETATSLNNLGGIYTERGDYAKAVLLRQRVLTIREKVLGPEHPEVANVLNNLAVTFDYMGDSSKAEALYQRALAIREKVYGVAHPDVATTLDNLGTIYYQNGKDGYIKAEPFYQRALAIREKALGSDHPDVAISLNNLALVYRNKGDYAKAGSLLQRTVTIFEKVLGAEHPNLATSHNNLALVYQNKGDFLNAITFANRASIIIERNIILNLTIGSEREKQDYLATLSGNFDFYTSLHSQFAPDNFEARSLAVNAILRRKGRVLDAMNDSLAALRRRASSQDQVLFDQLRETSAQLARLVLNGPQKTTPVDHQQRIKELEDQKEKLEAEISRNSSEFRALSQPITLENVQAVMPPNVALVEFALYRSVNPKAAKRDEQFGPRRYAAYVLRQQGEVQWADLGEAKPIDDAVTALRQAMRDPKSTNIKQLARAVDEKVMRPVRKLLGETRQVLLSPDGMLNLLPFAALVDEQNRYLVERYSFTYLSSGRDLLRMQAARPNENPALVVANPKFGLIGTSSPAETKGSETATDPAGRNFAELAWTGLEADNLKKLLPPQAQVLTGAQATETALKQAHAPRLLHIATHGFFLEDAPSPVPESRGFELTSFADLRSASWAAKIENPLLRSGLVLAGANERRSGNDDGVLTALEAAGLDLWGTRLVVLSACDTGVGEVKNGEGVYGLRRALVLAGAESQVMSLWPVSDKETSGLMSDYYERLLKRKEGRGEALRQAQLSILRDPKRNPQQKHPYYWAGFIQAGEWANLDGKR